ncbi:MAG: hypothetical protein QF615_13065 [Planctomycetota bacterium]|jgi:hypothetical protein|nr:hypothetical protein [Planctomycetota bacterium]
MIKSPTLFGALLLCLASCSTTPGLIDDHWSASSTNPRAARFFTGYDSSDGQSYRDYQWEQKQDINLTLRRHFFNHNPNNPYQDQVEPKARPLHSPLPNPANYIHLEGLALGGMLYAAGGAFFPVPLDSILGTLEPGGTEEFMAGVGATFRPLGVMTASFLNNTIGEEGPVVALWTSVAGYE